ncbi:MAG TPA: hypothetical protein VGV09_18490 [Steroidobacteraceae bacterium]|nr:hypothetical protein [Steroidobacteraceae bacterium]
MSVGQVDTANAGLVAQHTRSTSASLQGQIRAAREQLNDWVTCVSATTPKGQAEIRSLSAQISAAQEQIQRLPQTNDATANAGAVGSKLDVWA